MPLIIFDIFLVIHILCGAVGLATFWVAVSSRKGREAHVKYGRIFAYVILITSICAMVMSLLSMVWPGETHPKIADLALVRGIFGHFMFYLAVLTVSLVWHGLASVRLKADHPGHRAITPLFLQIAVIASGLNCFVQGWIIGQPLMLALPIIGFLSAANALWFIWQPKPWRLQYIVEHLKVFVGAGISVYTAFFAFGAVRLMPHNAFHPLLWATPFMVGVSIIGYHWLKYQKLKRRPKSGQISAVDPMSHSL
jgi:hypothetical protein